MKNLLIFICVVAAFYGAYQWSKGKFNAARPSGANAPSTATPASAAPASAPGQELAASAGAGTAADPRMVPPVAPASASASTAAPSVVICPRQVAAFDPANPTRQIGAFRKDTPLAVVDHPATPGMKLVTFSEPGGSVLRALCKEAELNAQPEAAAATAGAAAAPLESRNTIAERVPGTVFRLGNGQTNISRGCSASGNVVPLGGSPGNSKRLGE